MGVLATEDGCPRRATQGVGDVGILEGGAVRTHDRPNAAEILHGTLVEVVIHHEHNVRAAGGLGPSALVVGNQSIATQHQYCNRQRRSRQNKQYASHVAVCSVTLHPRPPPSLKAEPCRPAAVRQPGYLLRARRPMGFAPPPHDGFAFLASATRMRMTAGTCPALVMNAPYTVS